MRQFHVSKILVWFVLSAVLVLAQILLPSELTTQVNADGPVLSKWAETTPLINGYLRPAMWGIPAEWDDADRVDFVLSWGLEAHNASLYVKNDYINLYLAFVIEDEDYDVNDRVVFNFDNDHDGIKMVRDDQLWVDMWISFISEEHQAGLFVDGFFPTPADVPSFEKDVWDSGDLDGVGAAQFSGASPSEPGNYVVEVAHPLDTLDSDHDFSLGDGLGHGGSVGINVIYLDSGEVRDGWPTLTWGDWSQMATITLADPPARGPLGFGRNLKIDGIEVTQAVQYWDDVGHEDNSLPLAYGKSTIVRVFVDLGIYGSRIHDVTVFLYATSVTGASLADPEMWVSNGPRFKTAGIQAVLPPFWWTRSKEEYTINFLLPDYWVMRGSLNLVAFVKAADGMTEVLYSDNWMSWQTFSFTLTKSLRIGYYLIDYRPDAPGPGQNIPSAAKEARAYEFFEKVTPMPDLSDPVEFLLAGAPIVWDGPDFTNPFDAGNQQELLEDLEEMRRALERAGISYDLICGLYGGVTQGTRIGQVLSIPSRVFVAHEDRPWSFAHEIGHNYGLYHSWDGRSGNPYLGTDRENSSQTYGYDTQENWFINVGYFSEPGDVAKIPLHHLADQYGNLMSYENEYRWIDPYEWQELMDVFDPPAAALRTSTFGTVQSSSPGLQVSGRIYKNNTGSLRPVFQIPSILNITAPGGPYTVELRGAPPGEEVLYSQSFDVQFDIDAWDGVSPSDMAFFMLDLPFMTGTYSVSLWNTSISPSVLLDRITASANPPQVTMTYPNGGENVGDSFNATWTAADLDGDPLTFKLFCSSDNGTTWSPLSPRLNKTHYRVDTSALPGGSETLIRVEVSDGFHTSEDQSDVMFNVPLKEPQNLVGNTVGPPEEPHYFGEPIIFKGSAFDPEDGMLSNSSLTWTSNVTGFLGTGRVLTVTELTPGEHNITLTATDSHGNNATDSFTIMVEFHNIKVSQGTADPLAAYMEQTVSVNFTVANEGNTAIGFNVYAYAISENPANPDILIGNQSITGLPPNANITLPFIWDTSGVAYRNYTLSCYATPVPGELYTSDNYWILSDTVTVKIPGDINGDGIVELSDFFLASQAFGSTPSDPNWNPNADINSDDIVELTDFFIMSQHFGETW